MPDFPWTEEQTNAIKAIYDWSLGVGPQLISLTGPAGSGKTTVMGALKKQVQGDVMWTAMTGKAALRLASVAGVSATTLHSALYGRPDIKKDGSVEFSKVARPKAKLLAVDESSMLTPRLLEDLGKWGKQGVSILFIGDGYQLPPVMSPQEAKERGEDFSIFREVSGPTLTKVLRSDDDIIRVATILRERNRIPDASDGAFTFVRTGKPGRKAIDDYLADPEDHAIITWRNQIRMAANAEIRKRLGYESLLPEKGEPVLICKNGQDVLNGEIHIVEMITPAPRLAEVETSWLVTKSGLRLLVSIGGRDYPFDGMAPPVRDWQRYVIAQRNANVPAPIPVTYGYVLTSHKAQGDQYRRVTVFLSKQDLGNPLFRKDTVLPNGEKMPFSTRFLYTALTRAKHQASLILGE